MNIRRTGAGVAAALALGVVFILAHGGRARPTGQTTEASAAWTGEVDKVFAEWDRTDSPGCAVALYRDGRSVYARGYGMADLEHDVRITPDTVFYVGSVSKQFTAMAAALAIKQGKVGLDDDVRKYLPELPDYGTPITVRHLIHHTSGLRDVNTLMGLAGRRDEDAFDNDAVLRIVSRQKGLNFKPGDEHLYTNSGYALLALIVERATGTPFAQSADANMFTPLGMRVTHFHTDLSRLVKGRADAYERAADGAIRLNTPQNERAGAGGLFTSVSDLLTWDENFYDGRVGGMDVIRQMETPGRLNDGTVLTYAWGLTVGRYRGLPIVEHGGSLGGYRAHVIRFRDSHFSVACLCNLASINPGALVRRVADVALGPALGPVEPSATPPAARPSAPLPAWMPSAVQLSQYAGRFVSDELETTYLLAPDGPRLKLRRGVQRAWLTLQPRAVDQFGMPGGTIRFVRATGGSVEGLVVDAGRVRGIRFVKERPSS